MKKLTSSDLRRGEGGFALACDWVPGAKCGRPAGHNVSGARKQRVTRKWSPPCKASRLTFSDSFVFPARAHLLKGSSPSQTASPTGTECPNREVYGGHLTFRPQLLDSQVATVFFFSFSYERFLFLEPCTWPYPTLSLLHYHLFGGCLPVLDQVLINSTDARGEL